MGYQRRVHGAHSVNYCLTIMKTILVLACVALAGAKHIHVKIDQLEYGFCDGSAEPASIDAASVEPFPIVVATGETITLSVLITSLGPLPEIPSIIGGLLASGTYYADATITLADGTQMACLYVRVELAGH